MSEPLLEASLTAEGLLSITSPPGIGVEVGVGVGVCVGVGVAAEAVLAGWLDFGVGADVTTVDDADTDWSLSELVWLFPAAAPPPPTMDDAAPAAAVELEPPDNSSVGKELPTSVDSRHSYTNSSHYLAFSGETRPYIKADKRHCIATAKFVVLWRKIFSRDIFHPRIFLYLIYTTETKYLTNVKLHGLELSYFSALTIPSVGIERKSADTERFTSPM